ncbi:hypothetical protein [Thiorhodovibrio frisius]|uniref:Integrase n=1 Tax=Thiorhodovibrio frisius TaxID=631362 RepID=H8Z7C5_9GAMM|nr:hypothetical protein [Thiorhodovibrio frisius]EIC19841.1 hypothetical protein Thi970DRAFT_03446 [Thiorhodovibrio frisius]WPL20569.1 hypothetical protein Thiofri_00668 [Thiorhodovibrio frisius]
MPSNRVKLTKAAIHTARDAAKAIADYSRDIAEVKSNLALLKWMIGFNLAFTLAILWKVFT